MLTVAYAFSPDWITNWAVSCYSLLKNNTSPIKVYIFTDELNDEQKQEVDFLRQLFHVEITHIIITEEYFFGDHLKRFTKYSCYRLLMAECIKEDKLLYLDCDLVVQKDLSDFYNLDMKDNLIAGVVDAGIKLKDKELIDLSDKEPYLNAGVLLLNCKVIRDEKLTPIFINLVNAFVNASWIDQDVVNVVARGRKIIVDNIYNISGVTGIGLIKVKNMAIIHYAGNKRYNRPDEWVKHLPLSYFWDIYKEELINVKGEYDAGSKLSFF